jgi:hypothetical protein
MIELHAGVCGGHFFAKTTAHKIMHAGYYWPTLLEILMPLSVQVSLVRGLRASRDFQLCP